MQEDFFHELSGYVKKRLNSYNLTFSFDLHGLTIQAQKKDLFNVISFFHHDTYCQFQSILNMYVAQTKGHETSFLMYVLMSYEKKIIIKIAVPISQFMLSVSDLYKSAAWLERELWESKGIIFVGHRDLRYLFEKTVLNTENIYIAGVKNCE